MQIDINITRNEAIVYTDDQLQLGNYLKLMHMAKSLYYQDITVPDTVLYKYRHYLYQIPTSRIIGLPNTYYNCGTYWWCVPVNVLHISIEGSTKLVSVMGNNTMALLQI